MPTLNDPTPAFRLVLLLFLTMVACGDESTATGGSSSAEQPTIDACALLSATVIEDATGIAPGQPVDATQGVLPICNWPAADGSNAAFLTVFVGPSGNYGSFDQAIEIWAESAARMEVPFDADEYVEVENLGDFGAWLREAGMLQAHTGGTMVQVTTRVAEGRDLLTASAALARHALARLP